MTGLTQAGLYRGIYLAFHNLWPNVYICCHVFLEVCGEISFGERSFVCLLLHLSVAVLCCGCCVICDSRSCLCCFVRMEMVFLQQIYNSVCAFIL